MVYKSQYSNEDIRKAAHNVRKHVLRLTIDSGSGYIGQACSSAEILTTLYMRVMKLGESLGNPDGEQFHGVPGPGMDIKSGGLYNGPASDEYDRFFMSPPQYGSALYSVLVECGRLNKEALSNFNKDNWLLEVIASEHAPGFETSAGSLGQTISVAGGTAHARKLKGEKGRVVLFDSDGELEEGQIWEAVQTAVFHELDNLIIYVDANGQQCEGEMKGILGMNADSFADRFKAFGAVTVIVDGHDISALASAAETPHPGKPLVVVCRTDCAKDIPLLGRKRPNLHQVSISKDELEEFEAFYALM